MEATTIAAIAAIVLLGLIFLGVHIAVALGAVSFVGLLLLTNLNVTLTIFAQSFYTIASTYGFTVLPLFIVMGHFASASGAAQGAYQFASKWLSQFRGGLYLVTTGSCAFFAAATGSGAAVTVAIGKTVLPEMKKLGYDRRLSVACVAASGTLGILIPPSISLVIYGIAVEVSIGRLLLAGVIPGIVSAIIYMLGIYLLVRLKPNLAALPTKHSWRERFQVIPGIWGVALLFGIVLGGIYSGVFTPTEAGAIGALAAIILLAFRTRRGFFKHVKVATWETAMTTAMIFFLIMTAIVFTTFLTLSGAVGTITGFIQGQEFHPLVILAIFVGVWILMGMFMSGNAALLLISPLAVAALTPFGYNPVWLGIIMVKMIELGSITPPVGVTVYVAKALVPDMPVEDIFRGCSVFVVLDLITILILVIFPQISLWLPTMAFD
jgi:tripartite ATP-independent transporter DctM subunit